MKYKTLAIAALLFCIPIGIVFGVKHRSDNRLFSNRSKEVNDYLDKAEAIIENETYLSIYENKNGEKEEFISLVNQSLKLTETARAYLYLGIARHMAFDSDSYKDSVRYYQKALELNPEYMKAFIGLGSTHSNNKNYKECIHTFEQALNVHPQNQVATKMLGNCISGLKQQHIHECSTGYEKELMRKPPSKVAIEKIDQCIAQLERK
tara:strand:- start:195 stop:815 length:621 start_codon:yes stop_codon:yes gene_type:complete